MADGRGIARAAVVYLPPQMDKFCRDAIRGLLNLVTLNYLMLHKENHLDFVGRLVNYGYNE
jgi:hypothetical protein